MADVALNTDHKLKAAFSEKAKVTLTQIDAAEKFISTLSDLSASGAKPTEKTIKSGEKLLQSLEQQTEVYMSYAAILAGQEAASESELDRQIAKIGANVEKAETATTRLRSALHAYA